MFLSESASLIPYTILSIYEGAGSLPESQLLFFNGRLWADILTA
jgi:hypothetical protein